MTTADQLVAQIRELAKQIENAKSRPQKPEVMADWAARLRDVAEDIDTWGWAILPDPDESVGSVAKGTEEEDLRGEMIVEAIGQMMQQHGLKELAGMSDDQIRNITSETFASVDNQVGNDAASLNFDEIQRMAQREFDRILGEMDQKIAASQTIQKDGDDTNDVGDLSDDPGMDFVATG